MKIKAELTSIVSDEEYSRMWETFGLLLTQDSNMSNEFEIDLIHPIELEKNPTLPVAVTFVSEYGVALTGCFIPMSNIKSIKVKKTG